MTAPPPAGRALGRRWELRAVIAEAPGRVEYLALDREAGASDAAEVALWWLRPELFADPARERRLLGAAATLRRVTHPSVRPLRALAKEEGHLVAAWQVASAPGPAPRGSGAVDRADLCRWVDAVTAGLAELHRSGVVHGRLTPGDVVDVAGALRIGGAGLWAFASAHEAARAWRGLERFVAPEVRAGDVATPAADAYSVGAIIAEMVAGASESLADAMRGLARRHPPLHELVTGLTAIEPARRTANLIVMATAIRAAAAAPYRDTPPPVVDLAHPAFAPLTPVPGTLPGPVATAPAPAPEVGSDEDTDVDADVGPETFETRTIVGRALAPRPGDLPAVAGVIAPPTPEPPEPGAPIVLQAISMKPPDAPRPPGTKTPTQPQPRMRRISQAMVRTFSTAPGALGHLAPPKAVSDERERARTRRWIAFAVAVAVLAALVAAYVITR